MVMKESDKLDVYVGSNIGTFKHIHYDCKVKKPHCRQLQTIADLEKGRGVTCMAWSHNSQRKVIIGREDRQLQEYSLFEDTWLSLVEQVGGTGRIQSVATLPEEQGHVTATSCGLIQIWQSGRNEAHASIQTSPDLECLRLHGNIAGVGGKELDLTLWDLTTQNVIFRTKNVCHDWLQLRVPVWVNDIAFIPGNDGKLVAGCSRHGVIRLYDTRAQRRPVCSVELPEQALGCMTVSTEPMHVIVGTGRGILQQVDLRGKGHPDKSYKGATGAVTSAMARGHLIVSSGLDRHLNIHHATTKKLLHRQYLTTKTSCLLVRSPEADALPGGKREKVEEEKQLSQSANMQQDTEDLCSDEEYDNIFLNMEVIREEGEPKKKKKNKLKKSVEIDKDDEELSVSLDSTTNDVSTSEKKTRKRKVKDGSITDSNDVELPKKSMGKLLNPLVVATPKSVKKSKKANKDDQTANDSFVVNPLSLINDAGENVVDDLIESGEIQEVEEKVSKKVQKIKKLDKSHTEETTSDTRKKKSKQMVDVSGKPGKTMDKNGSFVKNNVWTPSVSEKRKNAKIATLMEVKEDGVDLDESIKKLLKSTEKTKKKLEQKRKDKKARSVFNC